MRIIPLAADSLGVRSMATLVEAGGCRIVIDPGVTLADNRFGLPPSKAEREALEEATDRIVGALCQADAVVLTHYHDDHVNLLSYVLSSTALYLKRPVTPSENRCAQDLFPRLQRTGRPFTLADKNTVGMRDVSLSFSGPLPHGKPGAKAGAVMAVAVRSKEGCFVHGSDVQGPLAPAAQAWLLQQRPDYLYLSGAPTYRLYTSVPQTADAFTVHDLRAAKANLNMLMKYTGCQVIIDHYSSRDRNFRRQYADLLAKEQVTTAAGFLGLPDRFLEARRQDGNSLEVETLVPRDPKALLASSRDDGLPPSPVTAAPGRAATVQERKAALAGTPAQ